MKPVIVTKSRARDLWIRAQKLDTPKPFGSGANACRLAVEHLGYVQIDTINVIERCHHHILFNRIPDYHRRDLTHAQSIEKSVFEYWTHALSYVPTKDLSHFLPAMAEHRKAPSRWFGTIGPADIQKVLKTIEANGALTIRDIGDEELIEKSHPWASKKPSKKALELAFYGGQVVISERIGMLKKYELTARHFGWHKAPKPATICQVLDYRLDRALRTQALVTLDSIAYLEPSAKSAFAKLIEKRIKAGELVHVQVENESKLNYWMKPEAIETQIEKSELTHLLSPFDPLVIQRKRLQHLFDYEHRFEAYLPKEKRTYGYFALPVLMDDKIVALLDLKTDRLEKKLLIQKWTWVGGARSKFKSKSAKARIETELGRFEKFQLQV